MYRPSGLVRKVSAPLFRLCAYPFNARPALANRSSSQSEATLTKTSASLGVTLGVASEPTSETRLTPRSLRATSVNRSTPMRRNVRRGNGSSGFELTGLSRRAVIAAAAAQSAQVTSRSNAWLMTVRTIDSGACRARLKVAICRSPRPHSPSDRDTGQPSAPRDPNVAALLRLRRSAHVPCPCSSFNVRANRPAEASTVSLVRDDAPCASDQAYGARRSGSG